MTEKSWSVRGDRDREGTSRRRELVAAARKVFETKGYGAATIADVTTEAGVSRATFYVYFASKQDVFVVLAEQVRDAFRSAQNIETVDFDDVEAVLAATIDSTFNVTIEHLALMSVLDHQALADPDIRAIWEPMRRNGIQRTVRYLERQSERGAVVLAADVESLAIMGTGMNELFAAQVVAGDMEHDYAVAQMLMIWLVALGRSPESASESPPQG